MSIFERWFGKSEEQKEAEIKKSVGETFRERAQKGAVESLEKELKKLTPEEQEAAREALRKRQGTH